MSQVKDKLGIIILAAGLGKRMKSSLPKVVQMLCGKPLISYVTDMAQTLNPDLCAVVLGYKSETVKPYIPENIKTAIQEQQLGTGHAVMQTAELYKDFKGKILVLCGDVPLLKAATLKKLIVQFTNQSAQAAVLTTELENPYGYGRIVRDENNSVSAIVEEKDADKNIKQIKEINSGIYCFDSQLLFKYLPDLKNSNAQAEYYLTDIIDIMVKNRHKVIAVKTAVSMEVEGINNRIQLAELEKELYINTAKAHLEKGVIIKDFSNVYIDTDSKIGTETVIEPGSVITNSSIGKNCLINGAHIIQSEIKDFCKAGLSRISKSIVNSNSIIGDFNSIESSELKSGCETGSNNTIKSSNIGASVKIQNNCCIDNVQLGKSSVFSNGAAVCSFDGLNSHNSIIGESVFIGAGCQIVSPVNIASSSYITSGTTIIKDVEENSLVMARPETIIKRGYIDKLKKKINGGDE